MKSWVRSGPDSALAGHFTGLKASIASFISEDAGATAIEYGLIAALISVALIGGASTLGTNLSSKFSAIAGVIGTTTP